MERPKVSAIDSEKLLENRCKLVDKNVEGCLLAVCTRPDAGHVLSPFPCNDCGVGDLSSVEGLRDFLLFSLAIGICFVDRMID